MKRVFFSIISILFLTPFAFFALQQSPAPRIEITGVNPSQLPTVTVTANVYDRVGQPIYGLTADNFVLTGELADKARIVSVENLSDESLTFNVVLAIDTSSSMTGQPIEKAKEAATAFINSIGPNDPVAIVAFDTTERLVQDYTTDKTVLLNAITNLAYGGKTALYDGSLLAVQKAAQAQPRRAVVLLSDGAEFGGRSSALRGDALTEALRQGVPVYTIGLGYGTDRTFLKELAEGTNAKNYESPTPEELLSIYQGLAATLRSQYTITIAADVPPDGTVYQLELQANTGSDTLTATADLRAPVPVPIVSLNGLPADPISEAVDVTADVVADDAITSAGFSVNGGVVAPLTAAPYTITVDPVTLPPGSNNLSFTVTDETGDTQTASQDFTVAALPSTVTLQGLPSGEISEPQTVTLDVSGQTIGQSATYSVDGGEATTVSDVPYSFTLDPYQFAPGEHTLSVDLLNQGGVTTTVESPFSVAALPPVISLSGVESGQTIDAPATLTVTASSSQTPVQQITAQLGDTDLTSTTSGSFVIDPAAFTPGNQTLTVTVTDQSGQSTTQTLDVEIAALPPTVILSGIQAGETLNENRTVTAEVTGQTPVDSITFSVDGNEIDATSEAPYTADLDVLALEPGPHILTVEATLASGQTGSADAAFVVSEGPSLTATAKVPTSTPKPSNTPVPTTTPKPSSTPETSASSTPVPVTETSDQPGGVTDTPAAQANAPTTAPVAQASATSQPASATPTVDTAATQQEIASATAAVAAVTQTSEAQVNDMLTQQAISVAQSQVTLEAQQTLDAQATANAEATADAQASATALAAQDTKATADARSTDNAQATKDAQASATAEQTEEATAESTAEATEVEPSAQPTEVAQANVTPTGAATETPSSATAAATFTQIPLTAETQTAATNNNILPIAVICIIGLLVLLVVFLVAGRRRQRQDTTRR